MIQTNIKSNRKERGFTIVELLVVIVVIGILAAITIVSYTGITARANTAANRQNASSVVSAVDAFYADNSAYPETSAASATVYTNINTNNVAKLPSGLTITSTTVTAGASLSYRLKSTTGFCVGYWTYDGNGSTAYLYGGDATADTGTCT